MIRYAAPGRINLIGEHTDYNNGLALPIAIPQRTVVTFLPNDGDAVTVRSDYEEGTIRIPMDTAPGDVTGWAAYIAGVIWALRRAGHRVIGGDMSIQSDVEIGSGLASSAALECATLGALAHATHTTIDRLDRARIAQAAENDYVGAPTGLMDQLASLFGEPHTAMLIDFRQLSVRPIPFDPDASGVTLLLINSHAQHRHAGGEYAVRRASCEAAAADLGVSSLREAQSLDGVTDPIAARRARHVLTENQRVLDFVAALRDDDFVEAGQILTASQNSMRDDFEITTAHIDLIADTAVGHGALGARMTGGGFGGCVIALARADATDRVARSVRKAMRDAGYPAPTITPTQAGQGAAGVSDPLLPGQGCLA